MGQVKDVAGNPYLKSCKEVAQAQGPLCSPLIGERSRKGDPNIGSSLQNVAVQLTAVTKVTPC